MIKRLVGASLIAMTLLTACGDGDKPAEKPVAAVMKPTDTGYYCSMRMDEHEGPKGQIFVRGQKDPIWVSSVQQIFAFRYSPGEPRNLSAIYVNDMAQVKAWSDPGANDIWIDAEDAYYVVDSSFIGGMGAPDILPFSDEGKAVAFTLTHGGKVMKFNEVPEESAFNYGTTTFGPSGDADTPPGAQH